MWLASLGSMRIDEVFDPEIAIDRAITKGVMHTLDKQIHLYLMY